jgi:hypothetical protein
MTGTEVTWAFGMEGANIKPDCVIRDSEKK